MPSADGVVAPVQEPRAREEVVEQAALGQRRAGHPANLFRHLRQVRKAFRLIADVSKSLRHRLFIKRTLPMGGESPAAPGWHEPLFAGLLRQTARGGAAPARLLQTSSNAPQGGVSTLRQRTRPVPATPPAPPGTRQHPAPTRRTAWTLWPLQSTRATPTQKNEAMNRATATAHGCARERPNKNGLLPWQPF